MPYNPESNGLAEAAVKNMKSLILRCNSRKGNLSMAIAAWETWPRTAILHNRRMKQLLPILPAQAETEEIDILAHDEAAERTEKNSNKCTDPRECTKFKPGE